MKKNNEAMIGLRLELLNDWDDQEEINVLKKYGHATDQGTIIRDILIPADMSLHNLHYAIQRLFGWQNSHLRHFELEEKDFDRLTGGQVRTWSELVGILFLGFPDNPNEKFWDDDYIDGNIKSFLRKKYTGPYSFDPDVEDYDHLQDGILNLISSVPLLEVREPFNVYYERQKTDKNTSIKILKKVPVLKASIEELMNSIIFDSFPVELLEKLLISQILAVELPTTYL